MILRIASIGIHRPVVAACAMLGALAPALPGFAAAPPADAKTGLPSTATATVEIAHNALTMTVEGKDARSFRVWWPTGATFASFERHGAAAENGKVTTYTDRLGNESWTFSLPLTAGAVSCSVSLPVAGAANVFCSGAPAAMSGSAATLIAALDRAKASAAPGEDAAPDALHAFSAWIMAQQKLSGAAFRGRPNS